MPAKTHTLSPGMGRVRAAIRANLGAGEPVAPPVVAAHVDPKAERFKNGTKHKYVMPLDEKMRSLVLKLAKPYPKKHASVSSEALEVHSKVGGAAPTRTLQLKDVRNV